MTLKEFLASLDLWMPVFLDVKCSRSAPYMAARRAGIRVSLHKTTTQGYIIWRTK